MRYFAVFMQKEIVELWRTSKALIVATVFVLLSLMSVVLAKLMPEILKSVSSEGMQFIVEMEATAIESYAQFFSNIGQMGLLMILIMFGAGLVREKKQGTAALLTARGLPRWVVATGKLVTGVGVWTSAYILAFAVCYGCTIWYFPGEAVDYMALAVTGMWFYGVMLLCVGFFLSTIFKSSGGPVGIPIALLFLLPLFDLWHVIAKFSPNWLFVNTVTLMNGTAVPQDAVAPFVVTGVVCAVSVICGIFLFGSNEL